MLLEELEIKQFRNYSSTVFFPDTKNLIVGNNGQGKSNLLEALVFLSSGVSFRPFSYESLVQETKTEALISAIIKTGENLKVFLRKKGDRLEKEFFLGEKKSNLRVFSQKLPFFLFSPEDLTMLKGSADYRRKYLDHWLSLQGKGLYVKEFNKVKAQKTKLLREIQKKGFCDKKNKALLDSVNEVYFEKSLNLIEQRRNSLEQLKPFLEESGFFLVKRFLDPKSSLESKKKLNVSYYIKGVKTEATKEEIKNKWKEGLFKEEIAGVCLYGPHRDDFKLYFREKEAKYYCSQGQQRGILLALKIAQVLWFYKAQKKTCLLLLDDVFSEIDKHLTLNLLHFLDKTPSQIILTSTDVPCFLDRDKFQVFYLNEGIFKKG